jgi:A/G-specific adenine glycosylase
MDKRYFSKKIAEWYEKNKRDLPWRNTQDPYKIWLSEIILQQTRVQQGLPYYLQFIQAFPSIKALADAPEQKILRLWQGLGYYTRARNLHRCAKEVVQKHHERFPGTLAELKALPGIGDYTGAAIASIAFNQPTAVVDGNVFRVLSRVFGISTPINSKQGKTEFYDLANRLISIKDPGRFNQAVMEFGALFCTPSRPQCENCVFKGNCFANKHGLQSQLPVKEKLKKSRKRYFYYFVIEKKGALLMNKRVEKDIWNGLFDFYLIEKDKAQNPLTVIKSDSFIKSLISKKSQPIISKVYKHILSHQTIYSRFIRLEVNGTTTLKKANSKFYSPKKVAELPKPILINRFLHDHLLL